MIAGNSRAGNRRGVLDKQGEGNPMSRVTLVGCIFAAALFLVIVGFFIANRPAIPSSNSTVQQVPQAKLSAPAPTPAPALVPAPEPEAAAPATAPPAKTSAVSEAAVSVPAGTHYAVDSGLFQDRNNAEALTARMPEQYRTTITPVNVHGRTLYRVRTIVLSESDANALAAKLAHDVKLQARITPIHQP